MDPMATSQTPLFRADNRARLRRMILIGVVVIFVVVAIVVVIAVTVNNGEKSSEPSVIPASKARRAVTARFLGRHLMHSADKCEPAPPSSRRGDFAEAAVVSDAVPCAVVGKEIFKENGSAVDAAIATLLCMGVYNAQSSGIGGGFLMIISNGTNEPVEVIDARETAPANATAEVYGKNKTLAKKGPLSIAVPGEIRGFKVAHQRYGRVSWERLFEPAIKLAQEGFPAGLHLARSLHNQKDIVLGNPSLRSIFVNEETGEVKKEGEIVKRPKLAETLKAIAKNGSEEMYTGETAKKLIEELNAAGSLLTLDDLKDYEVRTRNATITNLRDGYAIHSIPAPGGGTILGLLMSILDGYRWNASSLAPDKALQTYQRLVEAFKYSYAYRGLLGDPDFSDMSQLLANLSSEHLAEILRNQITDDETFDPEHYTPNASAPDDHGTAHMAVIAPDGSAVSVTSTVNYWFGSGIISNSTGILLNNEMDDFSFDSDAGTVNRVEPKKRPLSSMAPILLTNGTGHVILAIGAAGGTRIISGTAMVIARILWFDMDLKEAIDAPRIHHQLRPNHLEYEEGFPKEYLDGLEKIGHKLVLRGAYGSVMIGIHRSCNRLIANYDYRKGGSVDGY